jgi:hypothetical protein
MANECPGCGGKTRRPLPVSNRPYPVVYCANDFHRSLPKKAPREKVTRANSEVG